MYSSGSVGNIYLVQISEIIRCPDGKFPDNFPKYDDVIPNWDIRIAMFGGLGPSSSSNQMPSFQTVPCFPYVCKQCFDFASELVPTNMNYD